VNIHSTAVVDRTAELADDVQIGPFAVIEGGARIGPRCVISAHAIICGSVSMGEHNLVGYGTVLGSDPQDFSFRPETRSEVWIGNDNRFREYCTVHRGTAEGSATKVGDRCYVMSGAHLGHNAVLGNDVVLANNVLLGGHVQIGDRAFVGGGCVFHQFVRVGRLTICQGRSGFGKDIPPFTIGAEKNAVAGLNIVGLRRAGLAPDVRAEIKHAFQLVYCSGRNVGEALGAAKSMEWGAEADEFFRFIREAKKRGICALLKRRFSEKSESEAA
jgi:UDP-N-acetylglucosamine acyltransferase